MMHSEDYEWFTNQLLIRGEDKGLKLMRVGPAGNHLPARPYVDLATGGGG